MKKTYESPNMKKHPLQIFGSIAADTTNEELDPVHGSKGWVDGEYEFDDESIN